MENQKFYVIASRYMGDKEDFDHINQDYKYITTEEPTPIFSFSGWLGKKHNMSRWLIGEYDSFDEAKAVIERRYPDYIEAKHFNKNKFDLALFVLRYPRVTAAETLELCQALLPQITIETAEDDIRAMVAKLNENIKQQQGYTVQIATALHFLFIYQLELSETAPKQMGYKRATQEDIAHLFSSR